MYDRADENGLWWCDRCERRLPPEEFKPEPGGLTPLDCKECRAWFKRNEKRLVEERRQREIEKAATFQAKERTKDGEFRHVDGFARRVRLNTNLGTLWIELTPRSVFRDFEQMLSIGERVIEKKDCQAYPSGVKPTAIMPCESCEVIELPDSKDFVWERDWRAAGYNRDTRNECTAEQLRLGKIPGFKKEATIVPGYVTWGWNPEVFCPNFTDEDDSSNEHILVNEIRRSDVFKGWGQFPRTGFQRRQSRKWFVLNTDLSKIPEPKQRDLLCHVDFHNKIGRVIEGIEIVDSMSRIPCKISTSIESTGLHFGDPVFEPKKTGFVNVDCYDVLPVEKVVVTESVFIRCEKDAACNLDTLCHFFFSTTSVDGLDLSGSTWNPDRRKKTQEARPLGELLSDSYLPITKRNNGTPTEGRKLKKRDL
jgi:hypothetical protein